MNRRIATLIVVFTLTNSSTTLIGAVKTISPAKVDLAEISASLLESTIDVEATVRSINNPKEGSKAPVRISLVDDTGSITLIAWQDIFETLGGQTSLTTGDVVHVSARVTKFRDEIQLTLRSATDLRIISKSETPKSTGGATSPPATKGSLIALADVNDSLNGQDVTIQATISEVREPHTERAPFIITLSDGNAKVPMVFWSDLQEQIKQHIRVGNMIRAKVSVGEYRGTLQLRLRSAQDIESVSAPSSSTGLKGGDLQRTDVPASK